VSGLVVDLFAGGGGASTGIEAAIGRPVDIAINHSKVALAVHAANHPHTQHLTTDIWTAKPLEVTGGHPVWILWASPDCTHHSRAKGGKPRQQKIRSLAWAITRWAKDTRPEWIYLENVPEFETWGPLLADGTPCKRRRGKTFRAFVAKLRSYGYSVDWRVLDASHFGAPTRRRRLFMAAHRDGSSIEWPEATHGKGLEPFRTAAECIDWSLPCPSIFGRKRPLKPKTMWRIAQGLKRFVLDNPRPFVLRYNGTRFRGQTPDEPLTTLDGSNRFGIVAPVLQQSGYGERPGQRARVLDIQEPLGTAVDGQKHALVMAWLAKHFGDPQRQDGGGGVVVGDHLDRSIGAVTARDHHSLAAVTLAKFRGTSDSHSGAADVREPLPTVSDGGGRGGGHVAEVRAFLTAYYGNDATSGQQLSLPMRTVTGTDRLGLVMVEGTAYQIVDICMRMLQPHELLQAQFGKYASSYDLSAATTKAAKVKLIGNSVCPEVAEALIRANVLPREARAA
jgi:DNA (cytosine-5)-methyltransferase 1